MKEKKYDSLTARIFDNRAEMGKAAASDIAAAIAGILQKKEQCNMIFAAAPSQNEVLEALANDPGILWNRINAFHMDEYCGLDAGAPQCFGNFLDRKLFSRVGLGSVHYLRDAGKTPEEICVRYSELLKKYPADIVCLGIGENGHIAFNDPPTANFQDTLLVKTVKLDDICRQQQVHDGCFAALAEVPTHAVTLTIPALCSSEYMFCVVPASTKADAVKSTCMGPICEACPASVLRRHPGTILYLDRDSSVYL